MTVLTFEQYELLDSSLQAWRRRKRDKLRANGLDCSCPYTGDVWFHLFCDRLSCAAHADDVHDCDQYGPRVSAWTWPWPLNHLIKEVPGER